MTSNDSERIARARFYILAALRLGGVLLVMAGFAVIAGKWDLGGPDVNRVAGAIMVLVGAFDFAVVPLLLARRWKRESR